MYLSEARRILRQFAKDAADESTYRDDEIDRAIQTVCDDFILATGCTATKSTVALTADDPDLGTLPTGFLADMIRRAWITSRGELEIIDHRNLLAKQLSTVNEEDDSVLTGRPEFLAFSSPTAGEVYPTPGDDYTLNILYVAPLTSFTPGTSSASSTLINIPDHLLRQALIYGASAILQHNETEKAFASTSWQKYLAFREASRGRNHLGGQSMNADAAEL